MGVCANDTAACTGAHNYPISYPTNTQATVHNTQEHKLHVLSKLCELHGLPSQLCSVKSLNTPLSHARNTHIIYTLCP